MTFAEGDSEAAPLLGRKDGTRLRVTTTATTTAAAAASSKVSD